MLDDLHNSTWRLFLTVHATVLERIDQDLAQAGLPPLGWYDVLWALAETPTRQLRMHELAERLLLSRSNVTRMVDRLEKAGLLRRKSCPEDGRGALAVLTEEGLAMQQRMWTVYAQGISKYFAEHISDAEALVITNVLRRVLAK